MKKFIKLIGLFLIFSYIAFPEPLFAVECCTSPKRVTATGGHVQCVLSNPRGPARLFRTNCSGAEPNCDGPKNQCTSGPEVLLWAGPTIPVYDPGCTPGDTSNVKTALGCLPTDPETFVNTALPWAIGIGAGIAFLLGVFGAAMIVLSAGNPEKMQAGKEIITSAIAGLILIIFAIILLTVVGVDILELFLFEEPGHPGGGGR